MSDAVEFEATYDGATVKQDLQGVLKFKVEDVTGVLYAMKSFPSLKVRVTVEAEQQELFSDDPRGEDYAD